MTGRRPDATTGTLGRLVRHVWRVGAVAGGIGCAFGEVAVVGRQPYRVWPLIQRLEEIGPMNMIDGRFRPTLWTLLIGGIVVSVSGAVLPSRFAAGAVLPALGVAWLAWALDAGFDDETLLSATWWLPAISLTAVATAVAAAATSVAARRSGREA